MKFCYLIFHFLIFLNYFHTHCSYLKFSKYGELLTKSIPGDEFVFKYNTCALSKSENMFLTKAKLKEQFIFILTQPLTDEMIKILEYNEVEYIRNTYSIIIESKILAEISIREYTITFTTLKDRIIIEYNFLDGVKTKRLGRKPKPNLHDGVNYESLKRAVENVKFKLTEAMRQENYIKSQQRIFKSQSMPSLSVKLSKTNFDTEKKLN
jgi:hypothetical protein